MWTLESLVSKLLPAWQIGQPRPHSAANQGQEISLDCSTMRTSKACYQPPPACLAMQSNCARNSSSSTGSRASTQATAQAELSQNKQSPSPYLPGKQPYLPTCRKLYLPAGTTCCSLPLLPDLEPKLLNLLAFLDVLLSMATSWFPTYRQSYLPARAATCFACPAALA